ncbi:MAG: hypothetical protein RR290_02500 [Clostridia bacterium]
MIVVATQNEELKKKIDEIYKEKVYLYDITYMEGVIEYLSKIRNTSENIVLITKDNLSGNLTKELYIKQIRLANNNVKIILLTEKLTESYKEFLFANEVFNVLEGKEIKINELIESIENEDKIIYKESINVSNNDVLEENIVKYNAVISKQFISVYGTSGSGKSYISSILSSFLSKRLNLKIAMIDMDIQNPSIDIYNNLNGSNNILTNIINDIDKKREINEIIEKNMFSKKKIDYLTNNASIFECQNKFNNEYYNKIYYSCMNKYDYVLVDLPSSPFLDVVEYTLNLSTTIYFVINPNYISIRQGVKYLELITKLWRLSKENINIIVNKNQKNSLDMSQIQTFFSGYNVVSIVNFENNLEGYINGAIDKIDEKLNEIKILDSLGVNNVDKSKTLKHKIVSMIIKKERNNLSDSKSIQNC